MKGFGVQLKEKAPAFIRPDIVLSDMQLGAPRAAIGQAPRVLMGSVWWESVREQAKEKNNRCCWACGRHEFVLGRGLDGHERYSLVMKGKAGEGLWVQVRLIEIASLCTSCHGAIHWELLLQTKGASEAIGGLLWAVHLCQACGLRGPKRPAKSDFLAKPLSEQPVLHKLLVPKKYVEAGGAGGTAARFSLGYFPC